MRTAPHTVLRPPEELAHGDFEMVVRRLADDLAFGTDASRFIGSGLEYAKSRPYAPGDSMRTFDWRVTARTGKPFVKEYETLKRTSVFLIVDTSSSMAIASTPLTKHGMAVWIAGAVGLVAQRRLSPVAVVGGGERKTRLVASLIESDLWQALDPLRAANLTEATHLGDRLRDLDVRVKRSSVFIVISDLHDPTAVTAMRHAAQRHDCVALHLIDPAEHGALKSGFFRGQESETGRSFLGHGGHRWSGRAPRPDGKPSEIALELARSGVSYLALETDRSFVAPLRHFLASRPGITGGRG
ncbi:MAG: DUF58 domain-containing protein [Phycisphaerae bacterium]|nr:DUF58 domain-containing protein [Phycisphaerae bacterium]